MKPVCVAVWVFISIAYCVSAKDKITDAAVGQAGSETVTTIETLVNGTVVERTTTDTVVVTESAAAHEESLRSDRCRHGLNCDDSGLAWWAWLLIFIGVFALVGVALYYLCDPSADEGCCLSHHRVAHDGYAWDARTKKWIPATKRQNVMYVYSGARHDRFESDANESDYNENSCSEDDDAHFA